MTKSGRKEEGEDICKSNLHGHNCHVWWRGGGGGMVGVIKAQKEKKMICISELDNTLRRLNRNLPFFLFQTSQNGKIQTL